MPSPARSARGRSSCRSPRGSGPCPGSWSPSVSVLLSGSECERGVRPRSRSLASCRPRRSARSRGRGGCPPARRPSRSSGAAIPPAILPSSTSRDGSVARRVSCDASIARLPSIPPRTLTTREYGRRASASALCHRRLVAVDRGQRGRPVEHRLELGAVRLVGGDLQQAVLGDVQLDAAVAERPPDRLHLRDLQAPVVGHGHGRAGAEQLRELGDGLALRIGRHRSVLVLLLACKTAVRHAMRVRATREPPSTGYVRHSCLRVPSASW